MRQKELRIALVCYGGVSLAVYMHGVTKELWKLARASRAFHAGETCILGSEKVYCSLLEEIYATRNMRLRVLPDILTGASAGGINAIFLAEALYSGRSLEPLTDLWLANADVERLLDPQARPWSRVAKFWALPLVNFILTRPGNVVSESVAPETRAEVRAKLSRFIRGRWFEPPFSGIGFSRLLYKAFTAMAKAPTGLPLLPPHHPIDLFVTTTNFHGYREYLRLNSPPVVEESEHRMPIGFHGKVPEQGGEGLADILELVFAARSTASFPGAFPPLRVDEIDTLAREERQPWAGRLDFIKRIMPAHVLEENIENVSLIDGSVLVNAPFGEAMTVLNNRPVQREVDRRFVYIDPRPDRRAHSGTISDRPVGFFSAIFGSISAIPREQPIRDNLEVIDAQSHEAERLRHILIALRPEVEQAVDRLLGKTLFLDRPTPARLRRWRARAQSAAALQAGFAYHAYAQAKFAGIVDHLARNIRDALPGHNLPSISAISAALRNYLEAEGLTQLSGKSGGASDAAIEFFRKHDLGFRIRRLRLVARHTTRDQGDSPEITPEMRDSAREAIYRCLAPYYAAEQLEQMGEDFAALAADVLNSPGPVLEYLSRARRLKELDQQVDATLASSLEAMPRPLQRRMLLTYLGFPFYDIASLPLLRNEGLTEFDPVKVDRISPEDAPSIREGGTKATLRGTEFYNFGAFFSRAYRENDYLWGRLHGAERMIDLVSSTLEEPLSDACITRFKREAFLAILNEEEGRLITEKNLIERIRADIMARMPL